MQELAAHEELYRDFNMILFEAKRQEQIHEANKGEYEVARAIHGYWSDVVMPSICKDDWVREAATQFATNHMQQCFTCWRLGYQEAWSVQKQLHALNADVEDFVARACLAGGLTKEAKARLFDTEHDLLAAKESDLISLLEWESLSDDLQEEALSLDERAKDHEPLQLLASLRGMRDAYETTFPRVMYVVRRAIKRELCLRPTKADATILNPSQTLSWYTDHLPQCHPMHYLLVELADHYKLARNVGNHHEGFSWHPTENEVWLKDDSVTKVPLYDFQKRYRYFVSYLCDYGVRGILAALTAHERGPLSARIITEYRKNFPEDFNVGLVG